MEKIIRLTESDLIRIVRRVIKEQSLNDKKLMSEYSKLYTEDSLNENFWENIAVKMNTKIDEN